MQIVIFVCTCFGPAVFLKAESEHNEILALCKARDVEKAVALLQQHILGSRDEIKVFLNERESIISG